MPRFLLLLALIGCGTAAFAQRSYSLITYEYIFSFHQTTAAGNVNVKSPVRFSGFLNYGWQYHHDFGSRVGMFTGVQLRNVGMIAHVDTVRLKQRAYALGVPLAVKIGNTATQRFVAPGIEAEYMFNYKVKEFVRGKKIYKHNAWFSDEVTPFNPSVFLQFNFGSANLKFKYYLFDFLKPNKSEGYTLHDGTPSKAPTLIPGYPQHSKLFYVSFGTTLRMRSRSHASDNAPAPPPTQPKHTKDI